ncbi:MAG: hypothetical protein QOC96_28 [Acidobacteriota bacterium]|jgi:hypothetical protein|nr:hypothetical protein [Acidobacteriota bacterium]
MMNGEGMVFSSVHHSSFIVFLTLFIAPVHNPRPDVPIADCGLKKREGRKQKIEGSKKPLRLVCLLLSAFYLLFFSFRNPQSEIRNLEGNGGQWRTGKQPARRN